jgi:hypothetical protein
MTIPHVIAHNFSWKVVSVVLATLVWFTLDSGLKEGIQTGKLRTFSRQPITVMTIASDQHVFRVTPADVEVVVRGAPGVVDNLRPGDVEAYVNLTSITDALELRKLIQIYTPPGVTLVSVKPREVAVQRLAAKSRSPSPTP